MYMKKIKLHGKHGMGRYTLVDNEDYERVRQRAASWTVTSNGYVNCGLILLHSFIMETPKGFDIDHKNHNKLDNRRSNLRIVTRSQNNWNGSKKKTSKSGYKGVRFYPRLNKWQARIWKDWKEYHLGYFTTAEEAAMAYNKAAKKMHGVYRNPNVIAS